MGLFSRRRDDASTDSDESILASDAEADVDDLNESAASGPWDLSELPEDQEDVPRIDLGALQVPAVDGMQLRLEQGPDGTVTAVVLALGGSALELRAFAAPRTAGIWDELRSDIANELAGNGARYEESYGEYGTELVAHLPMRGPDDDDNRHDPFPGYRRTPLVLAGSPPGARRILRAVGPGTAGGAARHRRRP